MRYVLTLLFVAAVAGQAQGADAPSSTAGRPDPIWSTAKALVDAAQLPAARHPQRRGPARALQVQPGRSGKNRAARHPVLVGALAGFGGGCALGVSQVGGSTDTFFNALDEFACPVVGGIGAAIGAGIGAVVSR